MSVRSTTLRSGDADLLHGPLRRRPAPARRVSPSQMPSSVGPAPDQHDARAPAFSMRASSCGASGNSGTAVVLVQAVLGGLSDQQGPVGQAGEEQRHAAQVEGGVGAADLLGQGLARLGGGQRPVGHHGDEHQAAVEGQAHRPHRAPHRAWRRRARRPPTPPRSRGGRRRGPPPPRGPWSPPPPRPRRPAPPRTPGPGPPGSPSGP